jgi:hypothetical protein
MSLFSVHDDGHYINNCFGSIHDDGGYINYITFSSMGEEEGRGSGRKREHMNEENRQPTQHKKMRGEGE